jgi:hypothetical protein
LGTQEAGIAIMLRLGRCTGIRGGKGIADSVLAEKGLSQAGTAFYEEN